jgi:hypothetical protein
MARTEHWPQRAHTEAISSRKRCWEAWAQKCWGWEEEVEGEEEEHMDVDECWEERLVVAMAVWASLDGWERGEADGMEEEACGRERGEENDYKLYKLLWP